MIPFKTGADYVFFQYRAGSEIEPVIQACLAFAGGKDVEWSIIPCGGGNDILWQNGYVGAKLADKPSKHSVDDIRKLMWQPFEKLAVDRTEKVL